VRHARIRLNQGKTRVWNAAGEEPAGLARFQPVGADPVWTGAWSLPAHQQGLLVLGAPLGSEAFVQLELRNKRGTQDQLLTRLPAVGDLQCAWLLLLFCVSPRANYLLRMLPPGTTDAFARGHDAAVCACLAALLSQDSLPPQSLPQHSQRLAQLPLQLAAGGPPKLPRKRSQPAWQHDGISEIWKALSPQRLLQAQPQGLQKL